jgi:phosphonate degradation associated HDIG domain protein
LFDRRGAQQYGESVSQLEHALQCAHLAEEGDAHPQLVAACLLHDLGHLLANPGQDVDDVHQYLALPFLRGIFPEAVLEPMKLHVDAKRYLCTVEPGYWDTLSPASRHSLELQGGPFSESGARTFVSRPYAEDAVKLRRWDDLAKTPGKSTPPLPHYVTALWRCAAR